MNQYEILIQIQKELIELKQTVQNAGSSLVSERWVPRTIVMDFFSYGNTQIAALEKRKGIVVTKIGKRKFFLKKSLELLLDSGVGKTGNDINSTDQLEADNSNAA